VYSVKKIIFINLCFGRQQQMNFPEKLSSIVGYQGMEITTFT
jgi:hypothetical protein